MPFAEPTDARLLHYRIRALSDTIERLLRKRAEYVDAYTSIMGRGPDDPPVPLPHDDRRSCDGRRIYDFPDTDPART